MADRTLAEVALEVHAEMKRVKPEVVRKATEAGAAGGEALGDGIVRGADGRLRDDKGRFVSGGEGAAKKFSKGFQSGIDGTFSRVAAVMASKYALIGGAAAASAPGVLKFVGAIAPIAGLIGALPAALGSLTVASGTVKLAVRGVGDAIKTGFGDNPKAAKKSLDELTGSARGFAVQVINLKPRLDSLQKSVASPLFDQLNGQIRPLAQTFLPLLNRELPAVSGNMGLVAAEFAKAARQGPAVAGVRDVIRATAAAVGNLLGVSGPLANALGKAFSVGASSVRIYSDRLGEAIVNMSNFVSRAADTGRLAGWIEAGRKTLDSLVATLRNVGSIFYSVYQAANAGGNTLLGNLRDLTGQVAKFFNSAKGSAALQAVFATLNQVGAALRTSLGAALPAIGVSIQKLGPALAGLAAPAAQLVVAVAPLLPIVAGLAAKIITGLTPAIAKLSSFLAQNEGVVKALGVALIAYVSIMKTAAVVTAIQGAGSVLAWVKATSIATTVTKAFSAAQLVLGAAVRFALGPIGLIITAIGLLVGAIVYAYKNHEGFRKFVQGTWQGIQKVVSTVVTWFTGTALPWMQRVWKGIADGAVSMWEKYIRPAVQALASFFRNVVAPAAMWLWKNIFQPAFNAIAFLVKANIAVAQLAIALIVAYFRNVWAPAVMWIWKNVLKPAFEGIANTVKTSIAFARVVIAGLVAFFQNVVAPRVTWLWRNVFQPAFAGIGALIKDRWEKVIQPVLKAVGSFITDTVAPGFRKGVSAIAKAWDGLKQAALTPVRFVVNGVINPLIGGFNKVAKVFGTTQIDPIRGFAEGGRIPGDSGGRDDRIGQLVDRGGKLLGSIKVASGEFIVNARDTARALPLLRWINNGMKGGAGEIAQRIGRPLSERPGDGSEGWAFAKGGLVGFLSNLWDSISDPKKAIVKPVEAAMRLIPGGGLIRGLLMSMGKKLADGFVGWMSRASGGGDGGDAAPGNLGKAMSFVRAQNGKPYVWASAGPGGYDCSGIVSAAWNILHGRSPYQHTFSTGSLPGPYFPKSGPGGLLTAGWAHPGQRGASANVGHMAGQFIGGMSFESTGSRGVHVNTGRRPADFAHIGHFANGGLALAAAVARGDFAGRVPVFDRGGVLKPGYNTVYNGLGRNEHLRRTDAPDGVHLHFHNSVIASRAQAAELVATGFRDAKRSGKL